MQQKNDSGCLIFIISFVALGGIAFLIKDANISGIEPLPSSENRKRAKEAEIDDWYENNSVYSCEENLKAKPRDPASYERDGSFTTPTDSKTEKIVTWNFRAKNGFGGYNKSIAMCHVSKKDVPTVSAEIVGQ